MRAHAWIVFSFIYCLGPPGLTRGQTASPQATAAKNPPAFAEDESLPPLPTPAAARPPRPPRPPAVPADDTGDSRTITIRLDRDGQPAPQAQQYAAPPAAQAREFTIRVERPAPPPREIRLRVEAEAQQYATPPPQQINIRLGADDYAAPAPAQYAAPTAATYAAPAVGVGVGVGASLAAPAIQAGYSSASIEYPGFFGSWVGGVGAYLELARRPRLVTYLPPVAAPSVSVSIPSPSIQIAAPAVQYSVQAQAPSVQYQAPAPSVQYQAPAPAPVVVPSAQGVVPLHKKCLHLFRW